jgi:hypothetical protein
MNKYHVTGILRGWWDCECPDCVDEAHHEEWTEISEVVEADTAEDAGNLVEDNYIDNHPYFDDLEWKETPLILLVQK